MFFASLGEYSQNPWLIHLAIHVLQNTPDVIALLAPRSPTWLLTLSSAARATLQGASKTWGRLVLAYAGAGAVGSHQVSERKESAPPPPLAPPRASQLRVDGPPRYIRATLYHYDFALSSGPAKPTRDGRERGGGNATSAGAAAPWWVRTKVRSYLPALDLTNPSLHAFQRSAGWEPDASFRKCSVRLRVLVPGAKQPKGASSPTASPSTSPSSHREQERQALLLRECTVDGCVAYASLVAAREACVRLGNGCGGVALVAQRSPKTARVPKQKRRSAKMARLTRVTKRAKPLERLHFETRTAAGPPSAGASDQSATDQVRAQPPMGPMLERVPLVYWFLEGNASMHHSCSSHATPPIAASADESDVAERRGHASWKRAHAVRCTLRRFRSFDQEIISLLWLATLVWLACARPMSALLLALGSRLARCRPLQFGGRSQTGWPGATHGAPHAKQE